MSGLIWVLILPTIFAVLSLLMPRPRLVLLLTVIGSFICGGWVVFVGLDAFHGPVRAARDQIFLDALSAYHSFIVVGVFVLSSIYACYYFNSKHPEDSFGSGKAKRFGFLWFLFFGSMILTLSANNLGLMWVGMEATTITSALLVCLEPSRPAVRAAWTYLMMCSVAIALALLSVIVACAEASMVSGIGQSRFLWTELCELAPKMHSAPLRLAFVFALVGFGTKAGLAPMHGWLPEAHGQAPTPVSSVLSGVLLNCAIYCISRFVSIVEPSSPGWADSVLIPFGIFSMVVAAAFIAHEHDIKRLLAFHSVEHMGIITLGLGFGAPAAALFHTLNHSVCKMLTFFCAGAMVQGYASRDMRRMHGILRFMPVEGGGFLAGVLALIGTPPFSIFMSELWIAKVGFEGGHFAAVCAFVVTAAIVYIAAFRHAVEMTWPQPEAALPAGNFRGVGLGLVLLPLGLLLLIGIWMPEPFQYVLTQAAAIIGGP